MNPQSKKNTETYKKIKIIQKREIYIKYLREEKNKQFNIIVEIKYFYFFKVKKEMSYLSKNI